MTRRSTQRRVAAGGNAFGLRAVVSEQGFTLVEMTTSVAALLIVMTAAWLLLTTSTDNLNRIDNGGQASEMSRAALASFERDMGHAVLPSQLGVSAVLVAQPRTCSFLADIDNPADQRPELVTWTADDTKHELVRVLTRAPASMPTTQVTSLSSFLAAGSVTTTTTVLPGLSTASDLAAAQDLGQSTMFAYAISATEPGSDLLNHPGIVGLVKFRLRTGFPDKSTNIVDRTGAFRVLAYVINGY